MQKFILQFFSLFILLQLLCGSIAECPSAKHNTVASFSKEGKKFLEQKQYQRAYDCFNDARKKKESKDSYWWVEFAICQDNLNLIDEAIESYKKAIELLEDNIEASLGITELLIYKKEYKKALSYAESAVTFNPNLSKAHENLGYIYFETGKNELAIKELEKAVHLNQSSVSKGLYPVLAELYSQTDNIMKAIELYKLSVFYFPKDLKLQIRMALLSLTAKKYVPALKILEHIWSTYETDLWHPSLSPKYFPALVELWVKACDWKHWDKMFETLAEISLHEIQRGERANVQPLYAMAYPFSPELTSAITSSNVLRLGSVSALWDQPQYRWNSVPGERLRIGYVSPDLKGSHPLGKSIYHLFSLHDKEKFEIYVYFLNADDGSNIYRKIVADAEHTIDIVNMTNQEAAARINEDKIHILINLFGHSGAPFSNGIFALKPAPIAILHQGIAGEYGQCDYITYYTADKVILPPESRKKDNPQKALYMPDSYLFLSPPEDDVFPASDVEEPLQDNGLLNVGDTTNVVYVPALSETGFNYHKARNENGSSDSVLLSEFPDVMKENTFVFCYFGVHWKISPTVYDIWMKVLSRVDNSVLWMMKYKGGAMAMPLSVENLRKEATARGIDQNRILFSSVYPFETHLKIKSVCHMYLDTLEYNLHTVAAETLWTGVPGITWPQVRPASRVGASMLSSIGLPELVTSSAEEYEDLAVQYATDKQRYQQLRQRLRDNIHTTTLFNNEKWVQDFERGLQDVWHRYEEQEPVEDVFV